MFDSFERSWHVFKLTTKVIKKDKRLLLFPILGAIFSIAFIIALLYPIFSDTPETQMSGLAFYGIIFLIYFIISFMATFFNVCVVYIAKNAFQKKRVGVGETFAFAFSRIHLIFIWSIISATVGLILRILDDLSERLFGEIGQIISDIILGLIGGAWATVTMFVIPSMVFHNLGPFAGIKKSVQTLKKTWGESFVKDIGFMLFQWLFMILAVIGAIILYFVNLPIFGSTAALWIALIIGGIMVVGIYTYFEVANSIFDTALFMYAETGKVPDVYEKGTMEGSIKKKEKRR